MTTKVRANHSTPLAAIAATVFPTRSHSNHGDHSEKNDENHRNTTIFIKLLFKILHAKDAKMYVEAKRVVSLCLQKNSVKVPETEYSSLSSSLLSHLRKLVGGSFWRQAEMYFVRYLRDQESRTASQAAAIANRLMIKAAVAYSELIKINAARRKKASITKHTEFIPKSATVSTTTSSAPPSPPWSQTKQRRSVQFAKVTIREYEIIMGDDPSCPSGVPIALGWKYNPTEKEITIEEYEHERSASYTERARSNQGDSSRLVQLSAIESYAMLARHGVPVSEVVELQEECQKLQREREK